MMPNLVTLTLPPTPCLPLPPAQDATPRLMPNRMTLTPPSPSSSAQEATPRLMQNLLPNLIKAGYCAPVMQVRDATAYGRCYTHPPRGNINGPPPHLPTHHTTLHPHPSPSHSTSATERSKIANQYHRADSAFTRTELTASAPSSRWWRSSHQSPT